MNEKQRLVRRLEAYSLGHAVVTREARDLAGDPLNTFGITTIKIVTEEHIQALAFGDFAGMPQTIARLDPLSRDASDLEPFAHWLVARADRAVADGTLPRVWVPHLQTLETLDVLGHRYERNSQASTTLQRMGQICRSFVREYRHEGQQVVAVAAKLLTAHVATGQSAAEDAHLGALLAWLNPPRDGTAKELARTRTLDPASGVLANYPGRRDDEEVETLRRRRKRESGRSRDEAGSRIVQILTRAALDQWALLTEARAAFWNLPLRAGELDSCTQASAGRILYHLENGPRVPRHFLPRVRELTLLQDSKDQLADAQLRSDVVLRAAAARKGRVIVGRVREIRQDRQGFKPCVLKIESGQRDVRARLDDKVAALGTNVRGKVRDVSFDGATGRSTVTIEVLNGVRSIGQREWLRRETEWIPDSSFPVMLKMKALADDGVTAPWMLTEGATAPERPRPRRLGGDLLALAETHLGKRRGD